METFLIATSLIFIEELCEDILVLLFGRVLRHKLPPFLSPDWASLSIFAELGRSDHPFYPKQIVWNPCLACSTLPFLHTYVVVSLALTVQLSMLVNCVGWQRYMGSTSETEMKDLSFVWWPQGCSDSAEVAALLKSWRRPCKVS